MRRVFTPSRALRCSRCVRIRARPRRPCSPTANRQLPTERTPNTSTQSILAGLTPVLGAFPALRTLELDLHRVFAATKPGCQLSGRWYPSLYRGIAC